MFQMELTLIKQVHQKCILFHYWYFKAVGFKFVPQVRKKCHDALMTSYELKNIAILNVKGVEMFEAVNMLNISVLKHKTSL